MSNQAAWGLPGVLDFFDQARSTTGQVYASEWVFLKDLIRPGLSVLDIGCAQGGFAGVLAEHLADFSYTGIDINASMIERAKARHPGHRFLCVPEGDFSALAGEKFDLVLVLGILHLHEGWRDTIAAAWALTGETLLMDLRETEGPTVEDKTRSFFRMDFGSQAHDEQVLPYILVNSAEALATVRRLTPGAGRISQFGYVHPVSGSATTPVADVMANVWCVRR